MRFLIGDIGGTNSRLALWENGQIQNEQGFLNDSVENPLAVYGAYRDAIGPIDGACFGVAGPPVDGKVRMTNLGWTLCEQEMTARFRCPVRLLNDFHAQAFAVLAMGEDDWIPLQAMSSIAEGHRAVIGAGTGLGEAFLTWSGESFIPVAGEGSHTRFAPKNPTEVELLQKLMQKWPEHVSVERVVSGPGLVNIFDALNPDADRPTGMDDEDPAAWITREGLKGSPFPKQVLDLFVDTLADEAASLALKCCAKAVYVSGGIPPRIVPVMKERFRNAFEAKGRYRSLMETIPVFVVTHPAAGLLGAGVAASSFFEHA